MKKENKLNEAIELYKNSEYSINHICGMYDLGTLTLKKELEKLNIPIRNSKLNRIDQVLKNVREDNIEEIHSTYGVSIDILKKAMMLDHSELKKLQINLAIKEYMETSKFDRSIGKISIKYGINKKTLTKYLNDLNIEITKSGTAYFVNEHIFDIIDTEEKAYWLGFLYADGYIETKGNGVGLSISLKDQDHLEKYNKFLGYDGGMIVSTSHQFGSRSIYNKNGEIIKMISTVIHNNFLWKALNNKGCVPNKSLILNFPEEKIFNNDNKLILAFIRGYFDGDGTLGKYQHSKTNTNKEESLIFVGTLPFLKGIEKYLGKGYIMHKTNCSDQTYRLSYSTKKAITAARLMYENASIYLNRKYNIYINDFAADKSGKIGEL